MSRCDYPRGFVNCFWLWWFPASDALAVAPALTVALLSPRRRLPVSLLVLPPRPLPRRFPALFTAIALACLPWMKALFAPLEQTLAHSQTAADMPTPGFSIF